MTCRLGEQLAEELIEQYKAEHNGECPPKVTINLWVVECIRNEGTMEAQALSLLGVRPVYNASNQVVGLELIPQHELKRPRVDVVFAPSGLYRDIFPELMALLDKAVSLARSADEKDNFVREHILESEDKLKQLEQLPDSCAASADCLERQRAVFEQYHVFSLAMVDGVISKLRSYEDRTLRAEIQDSPEEMLKLVEKYFHCG